MKLCVAMAVAVLAFLAGSASAQSAPDSNPPAAAPQSQTASNPPAKPKAKHVWTNDDIGDIPGTISVVGKSGSADKSATRPPARKRAAGQKCEPDPWLAGLMIVLRAQGIPPNPPFWEDKIDNGVCKPATGLADLQQADGDILFDDGTRFRLSTDVSGDWPRAAAMVEASNNNRPFLVSHNHQPYVATKVNYIDHHYSDGGHVYVISRITMKHPLTGEVVVFTAGQSFQMEGTLLATVSK